jgi:hypothetical protein
VPTPHAVLSLLAALFTVLPRSLLAPFYALERRDGARFTAALMAATGAPRSPAAAAAGALVLAQGLAVAVGGAEGSALATGANAALIYRHGHGTVAGAAEALLAAAAAMESESRGQTQTPTLAHTPAQAPAPLTSKAPGWRWVLRAASLWATATLRGRRAWFSRLLLAHSRRGTAVGSGDGGASSVGGGSPALRYSGVGAGASAGAGVGAEPAPRLPASASREGVSQPLARTRDRAHTDPSASAGGLLGLARGLGDSSEDSRHGEPADAESGADGGDGDGDRRFSGTQPAAADTASAADAASDAAAVASGASNSPRDPLPSLLLLPLEELDSGSSSDRDSDRDSGGGNGDGSRRRRRGDVSPLARDIFGIGGGEPALEGGGSGGGGGGDGGDDGGASAATAALVELARTRPSRLEWLGSRKPRLHVRAYGGSDGGGSCDEDEDEDQDGGDDDDYDDDEDDDDNDSAPTLWGRGAQPWVPAEGPASRRKRTLAALSSLLPVAARKRQDSSSGSDTSGTDPYTDAKADATPRDPGADGAGSKRARRSMGVRADARGAGTERPRLALLRRKVRALVRAAPNAFVGAAEDALASAGIDSAGLADGDCGGDGHVAAAVGAAHTPPAQRGTFGSEALGAAAEAPAGAVAGPGGVGAIQVDAAAQAAATAAAAPVPMVAAALVNLGGAPASAPVVSAPTASPPIPRPGRPGSAAVQYAPTPAPQEPQQTPGPDLAGERVFGAVSTFAPGLLPGTLWLGQHAAVASAAGASGGPAAEPADQANGTSRRRGRQPQRRGTTAPAGRTAAAVAGLAAGAEAQASNGASVAAVGRGPVRLRVPVAAPVAAAAAVNAHTLPLWLARAVDAHDEAPLPLPLLLLLLPARALAAAVDWPAAAGPGPRSAPVPRGGVTAPVAPGADTELTAAVSWTLTGIASAASQAAARESAAAVRSAAASAPVALFFNAPQSLRPPTRYLLTKAAQRGRSTAAAAAAAAAAAGAAAAADESADASTNHVAAPQTAAGTGDYLAGAGAHTAGPDIPLASVLQPSAPPSASVITSTTTAAVSAFTEVTGAQPWLRAGLALAAAQFKVAPTPASRRAALGADSKAPGVGALSGCVAQTLRLLDAFSAYEDARHTAIWCALAAAAARAQRPLPEEPPRDAVVAGEAGAPIGGVGVSGMRVCAPGTVLRSGAVSVCSSSVQAASAAPSAAAPSAEPEPEPVLSFPLSVPALSEDTGPERRAVAASLARSWAAARAAAGHSVARPTVVPAAAEAVGAFIRSTTKALEAVCCVRDAATVRLAAAAALARETADAAAGDPSPGPMAAALGPALAPDDSGDDAGGAVSTEIDDTASEPQQHAPAAGAAALALLLARRHPAAARALAPRLLLPPQALSAALAPAWITVLLPHVRPGAAALVPVRVRFDLCAVGRIWAAQTRALLSVTALANAHAADPSAAAGLAEGLIADWSALLRRHIETAAHAPPQTVAAAAARARALTVAPALERGFPFEAAVNGLCGVYLIGALTPSAPCDDLDRDLDAAVAAAGPEADPFSAQAAEASVSVDMATGACEVTLPPRAPAPSPVPLLLPAALAAGLSEADAFGPGAATLRQSLSRADARTLAAARALALPVPATVNVAGSIADAGAQSNLGRGSADASLLATGFGAGLGAAPARALAAAGGTGAASAFGLGVALGAGVAVGMGLRGADGYARLGGDATVAPAWPLALTPQPVCGSLAPEEGACLWAPVEQDDVALEALEATRRPGGDRGRAQTARETPAAAATRLGAGLDVVGDIDAAAAAVGAAGASRSLPASAATPAALVPVAMAAATDAAAAIDLYRRAQAIQMQAVSAAARDDGAEPVARAPGQATQAAWGAAPAAPAAAAAAAAGGRHKRPPLRQSAGSVPVALMPSLPQGLMGAVYTLLESQEFVVSAARGTSSVGAGTAAAAQRVPPK